MLFRLLFLCLTFVSLSGCVTETSYPGRDTPANQSDVNNDSAAKARIALGLRYLQNGDNEQAKFNLTKALEHAPENVEANYTMAYYYQVVQENDQAEAYYRRAMKLAPDDGDVLNTYGVFLCGLKRYDEAEDMFLKAVNAPKYIKVGDSYENAALCAREQPNEAMAVEYFEKALVHSPNRPKSLLGLAEIVYEQGDRKRSEQLLERYHRSYSFSARSAFLGLQLAAARGDVTAEKRYGGILTAKFPATEQAKKYVLRDY